MIKRSQMENLKKMTAWIIYFSGLYFLINFMVKKKAMVIILAYHKIERRSSRADFLSTLSVAVEAFSRQMAYCARHYQIVSLSEACRLMQAGNRLDKDCLVVTCDDGYMDIAENGWPVFKKFNMKPIVFLPAGLIDSPDQIWHDKLEGIVKNTRLGHAELPRFAINMSIEGNIDKSNLAYVLMQKIKHLTPPERMEATDYIASCLKTAAGTVDNGLLTWDQIAQLSLAGMEFGSHTMTHQILSPQTAGTAAWELQESKRLIERRIKMPVSHFAYPDGKIKNIDPDIEAVVRKTYASAVTTEPGLNRPGCDLYRLKRIGVIKEMDLIYFKVKIVLAKAFL